MELHINTTTLTIDKNWEKYNKIRSVFLKSAIYMTNMYIESYDKSKDMAMLWGSFHEAMENVMEVQSKEAIRILFNNGIHTLTAEQFYNKYFNLYLDYSRDIQSITDQLEDIASYNAELQRALEMKNSTVTGFVGGGFGLGGAIAGALTASAMNAASGALRGIGNFFTEVSNNSKIEKLKQRIYKDPRTFHTLCCAMFQSGFRAFYGLVDELVEYGLLSDITFSSEKAYAINENAVQYAEDIDQKKELIAKSICMSPYSLNLYSPMLFQGLTLSGQDEFMSFFGIDILHDFFSNLGAQTAIRETDQLSQKTLQEQLKKIKTYFQLAEQYRLDISQRVSKITQIIVKDNSYSIEKIDETIRTIDANLQDTQTKEIDEMKAAFAAKRRELEKEREKKALEKRRPSSVQEISSLIQAYYDFSAKYNISVETEVKDLARRLIDRCKSADDAKEIINQIRENISSTSETIFVLKEILTTKQNVFTAEARYPIISLHIYSPFISRIVQSARQGDPFSQLWLIQALLPDEVLVNSHSKQGTKKYALPENVQEKLEELIAFLFDAPMQYSFDLFMRLRLNLLSESSAAYCQALNVFANKEQCVAGQFELAYYSFYEHNDMLTKGDSIALMKSTAEKGYYAALAVLNVWKNNKELADTMERNILYCEMLDGEYTTTYKMFASKPYSSEASIRSLISYWDFLLSMFCGEFDFTRGGARSLGDCLRRIWSDSRRYSSDVYKIGLRSGQMEDEVPLNSISAVFRVDPTSAVFAVYYSKDNSKCLLATADGIYWANHGKGYYSAYEQLTSESLITNVLDEFYGCKEQLYQICLMLQSACRPYSPNIVPAELEMMAFAGNPYAICRMIQISDHSCERYLRWKRNKQKWEERGEYYAICPVCYRPCYSEDVFCPNCGKKIKEVHNL